MLRLLLLPCRLGRVVHHRPKTAALIGLLFLAGAFGGVYAYAQRQWQAAHEDLKQDRFAQARQRLAICLWLWPHSPEVHLLAARADRLAGDFEGADAHLKECMKLQGGASEATQLEYLLIRAQMGEEEEVADDLYRFVEHNHPDTPWIMAILSGAHMHHLRYGPAYDALSRWIKHEPHNPRPYHWRGWVLEHLNNTREALKDYKKALELDPNLFAVRLRLAEIYMEQHRQMEAVPHLELLYRQFPKQADVLARLGECRLLQGRTEEGRQLLQQAAEQLPDDPKVLRQLAELELLAGRLQAAEKLIRRALKADSGDPLMEFTLYRILQQQGRPQEAATAFKRYQEQNAMLLRSYQLLQQEARHPSRGPETVSEIGILLLRMGQDKQGLYWLDRALQRDPHHQAARRALADYFERKGDYQTAAAHRRFLTAPVAKASRP
jgi:tetratricopeptide (TPR) repeat protein